MVSIDHESFCFQFIMEYSFVCVWGGGGSDVLIFCILQQNKIGTVVYMP